MDETGKFEQGCTIEYTEEFKQKAREKKYIVRDFEFNPNAFKDNQRLVAELDVEVDRLWVRK